MTVKNPEIITAAFEAFAFGRTSSVPLNDQPDPTQEFMDSRSFLGTTRTKIALDGDSRLPIAVLEMSGLAEDDQGAVSDIHEFGIVFPPNIYKVDALTGEVSEFLADSKEKLLNLMVDTVARERIIGALTLVRNIEFAE